MLRATVTDLQPDGPAARQSARAIYGDIWRLAWPVSISTSTVTLLTLVNLFWIGHLGTEAVAAVSLCANILFIVFGISNVVHTGALAIVARRVGENDIAAAFTAALHGVTLGALLGIAVAAAGYAAAPAIVGFFDTGAALEAMAVSYLRIMFLGQMPLYVSVALSAAYQAAGDTRTPMLANVGVVLINGVIDPFFIFPPRAITVGSVALGWLNLGTDGAAIAAALSGFAGATFLLLFSLARGRPFASPVHQRWTLSAEQLLRIARIGAPASLSMIARPLSTFLLLKVIASFGTVAIAAFGIALRSFSINWIPYSGINVAVASLVGQRLGSGSVRNAEQIVGRGLIVCCVLGLFFCAFYYGWARQIMLTFDHNPGVVAAGEPFLKLMALGFLFSAPMFPLASAMNGAGDTKPPMIAAFLANWPVKLPLAYLFALPLGYGVNGVWIGMLVSIIFEAIVMVVWYQRGTWKTKRV
jgi:putative MATE family efflux protein